MTNGPEHRRPLGIDFGSERTVGAVADEAPEVLRTDDTAVIPTRLGLDDSGFVVGKAATDAGPITPFPSSDDAKQPPSDAERDYPMALFFDLLRERWESVGAGADPEASSTERADGRAGGDRSDPPDAPPSSEPPAESGPFAGRDAVDKVDAETAEGMGDETVPEPTEPLGRTTEPASSDGFAPTTITVPGAFSTEDLSEIESAASSAGLGDVRAVRSPVAIAATELPDLEEGRSLTLSVADIDEAFETFAIVTLTAAGEIEVEARSSQPGGRHELDGTLARWMLNELESEHDVSLRCTDAAFDRVRSAAHDALETVTADGETTAAIGLDLDEGVEVTDGGVVAADALSIDLELDLQTAIRALNEPLHRIQDRIEETREAADADEVDAVVLAGAGTRPAPVVVAVENAFGQRSRSPALGDRETAGAIGAAVLSRNRASGTDPIARETLSTDVVLRALGPTGVEERVVSDPSTAPGDELTARVASASDEQLSGAFEIASRHRSTGRTERSDAFVGSDLPIDPGGSAIELPIAVDEERFDLDASTGEDDDSRNGPTIAAVDEASPPWLVHAGVDRDRLPERDTPARSAFERRSDEHRALASGDDEAVARAVWKIRNKIYDRAIRREEEMDADELELLVREFDKNLRIAGVEIISPEVGAEFDSGRHRITRAEESDRPEGTVLEVLSLGVAVDGTVIETAAVVAAK